jgi:hypothetical protein
VPMHANIALGWSHGVAVGSLLLSAVPLGHGHASFVIDVIPSVAQMVQLPGANAGRHQLHTSSAR